MSVEAESFKKQTHVTRGRPSLDLFLLCSSVFMDPCSRGPSLSGKAFFKGDGLKSWLMKLWRNYCFYRRMWSVQFSYLLSRDRCVQVMTDQDSDTCLSSRRAMNLTCHRYKCELCWLHFNPLDHRPPDGINDTLIFQWLAFTNHLSDPKTETGVIIRLWSFWGYPNYSQVTSSTCANRPEKTGEFRQLDSSLKICRK